MLFGRVARLEGAHLPKTLFEKVDANPAIGVVTLFDFSCGNCESLFSAGEVFFRSFDWHLLLNILFISNVHFIILSLV